MLRHTYVTTMLDAGGGFGPPRRQTCAVIVAAGRDAARSGQRGWRTRSRG